MRHPTRERLADLADGRLGALERSRLEAHISECQSCSTTLRNITVRGEQTTSPGEPFGEGVLGRARRLLRRPAGAPDARIANHFMAVLRFDSAAMPSAFGMRGSRDASDRQLLFEAGSFEIELHTRAGRAGWDVSGQVLGPTDATSGEVRLVGRNVSVRSPLSQLLEFRLPTVPEGDYRLELHLAAEAVLQIALLELQPL